VVHVQAVILTFSVSVGIDASVVSGVVIAQTSARVSVEQSLRQVGVRYARRARKWGVYPYQQPGAICQAPWPPGCTMLVFSSWMDINISDMKEVCTLIVMW